MNDLVRAASSGAVVVLLTARRSSRVPGARCLADIG